MMTTNNCYYWAGEEEDAEYWQSVGHVSVEDIRGEPKRGRRYDLLYGKPGKLEWNSINEEIEIMKSLPTRLKI